MRIAVAEIAQETDTFSPMTADINDFKAYGLFYGPEILERMRGAGAIGGLLEIVDEQTEPVELLPIIRAWAGAGGTITQETLEYLTEKLVTGLRAALPFDGLFLALHGAAAAANDDDLEGYVLEKVREAIGDKIPVIGSLDHHANITARMVRHATVLIGHETQPHDTVGTGRKSARALFRILKGEVKPTVAWRKIPMITPQDQFLTSQGPMKQWFDLAREMERRPGVIDVSPYPMQPWLDVAEGGWAVVVHTDNNPALAESLAKESAQLAWDLRQQFWASERVSVAEAVRQAVAADSGLIILSDTGDSIYGGAPGDSTVILRELVAQNVPALALVPIIDVEAVDAAFEAGVGATVTLDLGGKIDNVFSQPLRVSGRVGAVSHGVTLDVEGRGICDIGKTALLEVGQIRIVLMAERSFAVNHPVLYAHLGLEVADAKMVVVKTASNFQFFSRWRKGMIRVDAGGMTQSDLTAFDWKRVPRPMYPLDDLPNWKP